jgi:hypothetical protein
LCRRKDGFIIHKPFKGKGITRERACSRDEADGQRSNVGCVSSVYRIKSMLCGMVLGIVGLLFFAFQSRENYWLFHSLWHICVMTASFLLLKGKYEFFEFIKFIPLKSKEDLF